MSQRVPASMRTRQSLSDLIAGRLSSPDGRAELVKLATRLIVEETLEAENRDALGRDYYEHGAEPGSGYRNGVRTGRLKTAEGLVEYSAPQIAGRDEPFRSEIREHLKGRTQALEDLAVELLARGLSVRDIEDAFRDETGRLLLSRTAVSEIGERLWADYQEFADPRPERVRHRLSVRRRHRRAHPSRPAARAGAGGLGPHRDRRQGAAAPDGRLQGGRRDGHRLLPGHARPRARRSAAGGLRRRAGHHQGDRDLLPALGPPALPGAPDAQPRRQGAGGPVARVQGARPGLLPGAEPGDRARPRRRRSSPTTAASCRARSPASMDDFEACIAHLRMPVTHRRAIRTTNLLERLFVEERRRLKIIPNAFGERPVLKLMFGAMIRAAERWRAIKSPTSSAARWPPSDRNSIRNTRPPSRPRRPLQLGATPADLSSRSRT